jgi:hypothetical protein
LVVGSANVFIRFYPDFILEWANYNSKNHPEKKEKTRKGKKRKR